MDKLFSPWKLKDLEIRNRICVPPMVCFGLTDESGMVSEAHVKHYREIAEGGAGLIIQEAVCVSPEGRLSMDQLGIWNDDQIPGLKKIVDTVHEHHVPILLQIHHAGVISAPEERVCPSDYTLMHKGIEKHGRELSVEEIRRIEKAFVDAAIRAVKAGYDGVEIHGCHSYLLSQFMNWRVNARADAYNSEDLLIVKNIYEGIRAAVPENFVVGIRLGAFEPRIEDGIAHAKLLDEMGIDFIDVSYGFDAEAEREKPEGYPYTEAVYGAERIKKEVKAPVFAVNGIKSGKMADEILKDTGVDMADIGRGYLVNPWWGKDVLEGRDEGRCLDCPVCRWREDPEKCAGKLLLKKHRNEAK